MILQVGVKVLLKNKEGKILTLKRSEEKYGKTNGSWDIVGGRIDSGIGLIENLKREIKEETGLELSSLPRLIAAQDILLSERHVVRLTYVGRADGEPVIDASENTAYRWVTFEDLTTEDDLDVYVKQLIASRELRPESWGNNGMDRKIDIHKAGGILIQNRKFLVSRAKGKDLFISPGGKLKPQETAEDALLRELDEELGIKVAESDLEEFGTFYAPAAEQEERYLQMDVFLVRNWMGEIRPSGEIEEILWINSSPAGVRLGSIFEHEVLPRLKKGNLID